MIYLLHSIAKQHTQQLHPINQQIALGLLRLAYSDIKESFRYFIKFLNDSKPIILAAHSQGSFHSQRLLQEPEFQDFFSEKLISAYLIGYPLEESFFDYVNLEPCEAPSQIRSVVHFATVGKGSSRTTIGNGRPRLNIGNIK